MFGISFSELLLVGLVALLVLGPERLPGAARTAGLWVGRLKRSFNAIKQEVEREIGADEIRRQLHNEHILSLEQEARKIFNPVQQEPTPVEHVGQQTIHAPATTTPVVAATEPAPIVTPTPVEPAAPAAAPIAPAPHDPTLPPRAP
ncbi:MULTISPECIES: Sec-independent protein translocase protein TatB [unclassified Pseudomonas]|uniref:Sec-independent protein translocase protein TatB n=1 Tax=unclassified Pseudomonas TaxID=196821 RepID=UPI001B32E477|nr:MULTISPECIES: Sec-independent protein translocase protein TatB [unclassified Pseudomonas]MBP5946099.1 Sec-independent protein translocase subunit TatB [Pseudomonas sp. P9(2020)]MBZ9564238.1 Sec-independent protein translocase subunit TatB [Pseudomonas sp. P116]